jgi:hypothetical protein
MQINFIFQLRPPPLYTKAESETHSRTKREITLNTLASVSIHLYFILLM